MRAFTYSDMMQDGCSLETGTKEFSDRKHYGARLLVNEDLLNGGNPSQNPYCDFKTLSRIFWDEGILDKCLYLNIPGIKEMSRPGNICLYAGATWLREPILPFHRDFIGIQKRPIAFSSIGMHILVPRAYFATLFVPDSCWKDVPASVQSLTYKSTQEEMLLAFRDHQAEMLRKNIGVLVNIHPNTLTIMNNLRAMHTRVLRNPLCTSYYHENDPELMYYYHCDLD